VAVDPNCCPAMLLKIVKELDAGVEHRCYQSVPVELAGNTPANLKNAVSHRQYAGRDIAPSRFTDGY